MSMNLASFYHQAVFAPYARHVLYGGRNRSRVTRLWLRQACVSRNIAQECVQLRRTAIRDVEPKPHEVP